LLRERAHIRAASRVEGAAGKTGTGDNNRDAWFIGFTANYVAGVWVGSPSNNPLPITGGGAAATWANIMSAVQ
jgi:membrane peptidoglycan carboxypeptidase